MTDQIRLVDYLSQVQALIKGEFNAFSWVKAEIAKLNMSQSAIYLDLVESDENGIRIASCRAAIWQQDAQKILAKFRDAAGIELSAETKVLILVKPSFHPDYGFSLQIKDIDPLYTIGDMAQKLADIKRKLIDSGDIDNQKRITSPNDFTRVAVLSPDSAAGLGDFRSDADALAQAGICQFDYFSSIFQGKQAKADLIQTLRIIYKENEIQPYDCLVVIRGGGSTSDLNYLNEYDLARAITKFKIPVFAGIGHERDHTILDDVAHTAFDTPSKVIHHLIRTISDQVVRLDQAILFVVQSSEAIISDNRSKIDHAHSMTKQASQHLLERTGATAQKLFSGVSQLSEKVIYQYASEIQRDDANVKRLLEQFISASEKNCYMLHQKINSYCISKLEWTDQALKSFHQSVFKSGMNVLESTSVGVSQPFISLGFYAKNRLENASQSISQQVELMHSYVNASLQRAETYVLATSATIDVASPKNTLSRGFCIVRNDLGAPLKNKSDAITKSSLTIEFRDGSLLVNQ